MRFLVDAHLPRRLARRLAEAGHDAVHTLDLPAGNRTRDEVLNEISVREQRILVTKDADFLHSIRLRGRPFKLLLVTTGNISNRELEHLVLAHLALLADSFAEASVIELGRTSLIIHA